MDGEQAQRLAEQINASLQVECAQRIGVQSRLHQWAIRQNAQAGWRVQRVQQGMTEAAIAGFGQPLCVGGREFRQYDDVGRMFAKPLQ